MFDMRETLTSVAESLRSWATGGTKNLMEFSLPTGAASSQIECANDPLTCWLVSLTV